MLTAICNRPRNGTAESRTESRYFFLGADGARSGSWNLVDVFPPSSEGLRGHSFVTGARPHGLQRNSDRGPTASGGYAVSVGEAPS